MKEEVERIYLDLLNPLRLKKSLLQEMQLLNLHS